MILGASHLLALRKQRLVPRAVMVSVGVPYRPPKYENDHKYMELVVDGPIDRDDFRIFVGLRVSLFCPEYDAFAHEVLEKLKEQCEEITILVAGWGEDIGFLWSKRYGQLDMGVVGWLDQYYEAKGRVCRTPAEVQERVRLESEALSHLEKHPSEYSNG